MTYETLCEYDELKKGFDFSYEGKKYRVYFEIEKGKSGIYFGILYETPQCFRNLHALQYDAKVGSHYFKDVLSYIIPE